MTRKFDEGVKRWIDSFGNQFIRNEFVPDQPVWIHVKTDEWSAFYKGVMCRLSWPKPMDAELRLHLECFFALRLRRHSPSALSNYNALCVGLVEHNTSFENLNDLKALRHLWDRLKSHNRIFLREFMRFLIQIKSPKICANSVSLMRSWKARNQIVSLRAVRSWDPKFGALSTSELELVRRALSDRNECETLKTHHTRVFARVLLATLRRTSQIAEIGADGLKEVSTHSGKEFYLQIPKAKFQAREESEWERIPTELAYDIQDYRKRLIQQGVSLVDPVLLPVVRTKEGVAIRISSSDFRQNCTSFFRNLNVKSPRTGKPLVAGMRRIRHTGATQMAMQGYSREVIQAALQHDSPLSASAYIDSVGADFVPVFENMDHRLGGKFASLRDVWFEGQIVDNNESDHPTIRIPDLDAPAVVGACRSENGCSLHPLFSCYSCPQFLAFREAEHARVLDFVEKDYLKWRTMEPQLSRSKALKDFDRIFSSIKNVISEIEGS